MINFLKNLHKEESGQDLIEYALIGLLIALGAIAGMSTVASSINAEFTKIAGKAHLVNSECQNEHLESRVRTRTQDSVAGAKIRVIRETRNLLESVNARSLEFAARG